MTHHTGRAHAYNYGYELYMVIVTCYSDYGTGYSYMLYTYTYHMVIVACYILPATSVCMTTYIYVCMHLNSAHVTEAASSLIDATFCGNGCFNGSR